MPAREVGGRRHVAHTYSIPALNRFHPLRPSGHLGSTHFGHLVQLAKFLLEECGLEPSAFAYDDDGALARIRAPQELVERVVRDGHAFMTNGCPGAGGEPGCTRPMGSWRPGEAPRDYPWRPTGTDWAGIVEELALGEVLRPGPGPTRPPEQWAPPAAGRVPSRSAIIS